MIPLGENKYLLDSVENITWDSQNFPVSNMHAIHHTLNGIRELAHNTRKVELEKFKKNDWNTSGTSLLETDIGMLHNYFIWFSISITNYLRLVAFVQYCNDKEVALTDLNKPRIQRELSKHCSDYTKTIIPEIVTWRNKVGAHYSLTDPRRDDNILSLINSVNSIGLGRSQSPYYSTGVATFHTGGTEGQENNIPPWSLTKTYDDLCNRFFAKRKLQMFSEYYDQENKPQQIDSIKKLQIFAIKATKSKKRNLKKAEKFHNKGVDYSKQGHHEKAIREFKKSLFEHNGNLNSWNNLAVTFWDAKKYFNALKIFDVLFEKGEENDFSKLMYGKLLGIRFGDRKKATRILARIPENSTYYDEAKKCINFFEKLSEV